MVWREFGRPVLFRQTRVGLNEAHFEMMKFRTMTEDRDAEGRRLPDGDRLTPLGRFLRDSSLDELPELFLVLNGTMSLVGPRPLLVPYIPRYSPRERRRHLRRPGLTGLAQISGRNSLTWSNRLELDVQYVENTSFRLDLQILVRTMAKVLRRADISAPGHSTMTSLDSERVG